MATAGPATVAAGAVAATAGAAAATLVLVGGMGAPKTPSP